MNPHWNLFDSYAVVGRHLKLAGGGLHTPADLLAEMDHFGVAEALVVDSLARENHPAEGNARVLQAVRGLPRLRPAWSALPHGGTDEQDHGEQFLARMRQAGVAALFLFPSQYRFNLDAWCVDALLEPLEAAGVPVFIDYVPVGPGGRGQDLTDWPAVVGLCRRRPKLPVIVSEFRIRHTQRLAYRAMDACPNLRVGLSAWWLHHGIEYVTRRWDSGRMVFCSYWPAMGQGPTLGALSLADISEADKRAIAGDNLRRLIAWNAGAPAAPAPQPAAPADEFVAIGRTGRLPDALEIWDCHGHLGGRSSSYHLPDATLEATVAEMDRLHVRKVCVFSFAGVSSDEQHGNDLVAEAVRRYPDRFVGFTLLNPHRGRDEMLRELVRGAAMGLRGVKLIPYYQGYPEEGPLIDVACQWAHERRQIILNHNWGSPQQIDRLAGTYVHACFITGHATTIYADVMKRRPNIHVCTCPLLGPRSTEETVAAVGANRLLFGSDLQDLPIGWGLGPVLFARIPAADKRLILGGNLQRILERYSLRP